MLPYVIYARKSSESEDRQVLSIEAQFEELQSLAAKAGIEVSEKLSESRSAKSPGRPVFGALMEAVSKGRISGILSWRLDRLARNPVDGAALIWAMELGQLKHIMTAQRTFTPSSDDKFLMQLEFGIAKKYVDDLSENVKRGNRQKLKHGWLPGRPPLGYLNDRSQKIIVPDPDRFELVRRIWRRVLEGVPVPEVLEEVNEAWGFRTPKRPHSGGARLVPSVLYALLSNPFYFGMIQRAGEAYPGAHTPMISKTEFDEVQRLIGRDVRPPRRKQTFDFSGLMTCGECGFAITAEKHPKNGQIYVYYRCSKRHPHLRCQQPYVPEAVLEDQFAQLLDRLVIPQDVLAWYLKRLEGFRNQDLASGKLRQDRLQKALEANQRKTDRLLDLRLDEQVGDAEFLVKRQALVAEQVSLRQKLQGATSQPQRWFELTKNALSLGKRVTILFQKGSSEQKRSILLAVGSNYQLRDKTLLTLAKKPFDLLVDRTNNPDWWARLDAVRTYFLEHPDAITWPDFMFPPGWDKLK